MAEGGFTEINNKIYADDQIMSYFAEREDNSDSCSVFISENASSSDYPVLLEGPSIIGIKHGIDEISAQGHSEFARNLFYPKKPIQNSAGSLDASYKKDTVYKNLAGGETRVKYVTDGSDDGIILIDAFGSGLNEDYKRGLRIDRNSPSLHIQEI